MTMNSLQSKCLEALLKLGRSMIHNVLYHKENKKKIDVKYITKVLKTWSLTNSVQRYKNIEEWMIQVQDLNHPNAIVAIELTIKSCEEFQRFHCLWRHLFLNFSQHLETEALNNDVTTLLVTRPGPVLIRFIPQRSDDYHHDCVLQSSAVKSVVETLKQQLRELCLFTKRDECIENKVVKDLSSRLPSEQLEEAYIAATDGKVTPNSSLDSHGYGEIERLKKENDGSKKVIATLTQEIERTKHVLQSQLNEVVERNSEITRELSRRDVQLEETYAELGRLSVEMSKMRKEKRTIEMFQNTYYNRGVSSQRNMEVSRMTTSDVTSSGDRVMRLQEDIENVGRIEVDNHGDQETISSIPNSHTDDTHTGVDRNIFNNFRLLFLRISSILLKHDVISLKSWVETEFEIDSSLSAMEIFDELIHRGIVSVSYLAPLRRFFEGILRYDLVWLIDNFLLGDYTHLKNRKPTGRLGSHNPGLDYQGRSSGWHPHSASARAPVHTLFNTSFRGSMNGRSFSLFSQSNTRESGESRESTSEQRNQNESNNVDSNQYPSVPRDTVVGKHRLRNLHTTCSSDSDVMDGRARAEAQVSGSTFPDQGDISRGNIGSNGQKLSKPLPHESSVSSTQSRDDDTTGGDGQWLCSHYQRRCYVQFECCRQFWPCHRCHNNQGNCSEKKKLKSRDTVRLKCVVCGLEQQFQQFCSQCNTKFAEYFCIHCKHLTGTDDNPYHCVKCGICRVHGDRSFHCDVCGVCLDVQLRGNHKCREGSAHDECCICLEDAFTGCQILPCSHKVHKECAAQMIRSGITRCPICRQSFAHKLERKSTKKHQGK